MKVKWVSKMYCTPIFTIAVSTIAEVWERLKCVLIDEWISKVWYTFTMEYYLPSKRKEMLTHTTNE